MVFPRFRRCINFFQIDKATKATPIEANPIISKQDSDFTYETIIENDLQRVPITQETLLLYEPKQTYTLVKDSTVPNLQNSREILIQVTVIGLNPIDWKAPAYNFGLPSLPCVLGRDFVGVVLKAPKEKSRIRVGDKVLSVSTDYRDYRKSAFQQYSIASDFNVCRIPSDLSPERYAPLGVAFVAATIALGICLGVNFQNDLQGINGPDLWSITQGLSAEAIPDDVRGECLNGIKDTDRPRKGDWLAIWGASSTVGYIALQLAKKAGLRVICVVDAIKHGSQIVDAGADVLVHRRSTEEVVAIIRSVTNGQLRFGLDTVGKETSTSLQAAMKVLRDSDCGPGAKEAHLTGMTGLPKENVPGIIHHKVPIKLFHELPEIGQVITYWLENLLAEKALQLPKINVCTGGLGGINSALDLLKSGNLEVQRLVVPI